MKDPPHVDACLPLVRCWVRNFCHSYVKEMIKVICCRHVPETLEEPIKAALVVYVVPTNNGLSAALEAWCTCAPLLAACLPPDDGSIPSATSKPLPDMERCVSSLNMRMQPCSACSQL